MAIQPYLVFNGRAEEAIEFYRGAVGAEVVMMMRFKDSPEPPPPGCMPPGTENLVMHASIHIGGPDGLVMISDGMAQGGPEFKGFSLSISVADEATARKTFDALAAGGTVGMPLGRTFWSPCFGMLTDRFGVGWMVGVQAPAGA